MKFASSLLCILAVSLCMSSVLGFSGRAQTALNVRSQANSHSNVIGVLSPGSSFDIDCQVGGETIQGTAGTTNTWYHVPSRGGFVSAAYVSNNGQSAPGCGGPARVKMTGGETLNVRSGPNTHSSVIGSLPANAEIGIDCQTNGDNISGPAGTTSMWYHVPSKGGFVSGAFVSGAGSYPGCGNIPTPSGGDCSAGLSNPRSCSEAVAWATAHLTNSYNSEYRGLCDHFVGLAYGRSASGFDTAYIHWQTTPDRFKHPGDRNPPPGALCFFKTSAAGHACLSTGGGGIISTDWGCSGCLGRTSISQIEASWGPYLGWTAPYFHNA